MPLPKFILPLGGVDFGQLTTIEAMLEVASADSRAVVEKIALDQAISKDCRSQKYRELMV